MGKGRQSSAIRGTIAELRATQFLLEMGWEVAQVLAGDASYDLLLRRSSVDAWETVQVKRTYPKRGSPTVNLVRQPGRRYQAHEADWLAAVEVSTGRVWLVPFSEVCQYSRKAINQKMDQYELLASPRGASCATQNHG